MKKRVNGKRYVLYLFIAVVSTVLLAACDMPDAEQRRQQQHLPGPDFVADAAKGAQVFAENCARCHGAEAKGTNQGPPLIHKVYRPGHHADIAFHWAVKDGTKQHHWQFGDMPPIKGVSPDEVGHVIAYIRKEQRNAGIN